MCQYGFTYYIIYIYIYIYKGVSPLSKSRWEEVKAKLPLIMNWCKDGLIETEICKLKLLLLKIKKCLKN